MLWRLYDLLSRNGQWKQDAVTPHVERIEEKAEADLPAISPYGDHIP